MGFDGGNSPLVCIFKDKRAVVFQDVKMCDKMDSPSTCNERRNIIGFDIKDSNIIVDVMMEFDLDVISDHGDESPDTESGENTSRNSESIKINRNKIDDVENQPTYGGEADVFLNEDIDEDDHNSYNNNDLESGLRTSKQ